MLQALLSKCLILWPGNNDLSVNNWARSAMPNTISQSSMGIYKQWLSPQSSNSSSSDYAFTTHNPGSILVIPSLDDSIGCQGEKIYSVVQKLSMYHTNKGSC